MNSARPSAADQSFLQAVLDVPEDDAARLIYADWLLENGDPRGEFIQVQCRLAALRSDDAERRLLLAREKALLTKHGPAWLAPIARLVEEARFRRGFVEQARLSAAQFLKNADLLLRRTPLRSLELTHLDGRLADVMASPHLGRIEVLDLSGNALGSRSLRLLSNCPFLEHVHHLCLCRCEINAESAQVFRGAPLVERLESFDLGSNSIGADGARALADNSLPRLTSLRLPGNAIQDLGVQALLRPGRRFTNLHLRDNGIGNAGMEALARWPGLGRLLTLDVENNVIGNAGCLALGSYAGDADLSWLSLAHNQVGDRGVEALAGCPLLRRLTHLNLASNELGDLGCQALAEAPHSASLQVLNLDYNRIYEKGARALAASPYLEGLTRLQIKSRTLGAAGKRALEQRFGARVRF